MKTLSLSGWLQPPEALDALVSDVQPFRYDHLAGLDAVLPALAAEDPETVIGWSLGGVLAAEALIRGEYRPRKLVLIATPYRFLASPEVPDGMSMADYEAFRQGYTMNPKVTARKLQLLSNHGMPEADDICPLAENAEEVEIWLPWLTHLAAADFSAAKIEKAPEILIVQGSKDAICAPAQAKYWPRIFPNAKVLILPRASHAPHRQDALTLQPMLSEFFA